MSLKQFFDALAAEHYKIANRCENYWSTPEGACVNGGWLCLRVGGGPCRHFKEKEEK